MNTSILKKFKLGLISLSAFTILAACGDTTEDMPDTETPQETTEDADNVGNETDEQTGEQDTEDQNATGTDAGTATSTAGVLSMDFQISLDDAVQTFHDTFGENVNIDQVDFDEDDGQFYYDIQGWDDQNEYEIEISAETGDIRHQSTEAEDDIDEDILEIENYVTPEEAMNAAVESANTDVIEGWSLDIENGRPIFEIDFEGADDIDVDAESGEVI